MAFHLSGAQRSASARKAAATRSARGEKAFRNVNRSANAKKAAATRKARGVPLFGGHPHRGFHLSAAVRSSNARKAAATRKAHGVKPFGHLSVAAKHARAEHAAATRKAKGEHPFGHMTAEQRHERAVHAAATRARKHPPRTISEHNRLHKVTRSNFLHAPRTHKLHPLVVRRKRPRQAIHVRHRSHFDRHKRMVI